MFGMQLLTIIMIAALVFTPYVLGVNIIVHGRGRGYSLLALSCLVVASLGVFAQSNLLLNIQLALLIMFLVLCTSVLSEAILRGIAPVVAILSLVIFSFVVSMLGVGLYELSSDTPLVETLIMEYEKELPQLMKVLTEAEQTLGEDLHEQKALFANPKTFIETNLPPSIAGYFEFLTLIVWLNMYFLLRANRLFKRDYNPSGPEWELTSYTVSSYAKYILAIILVTNVLAGYLQSIWLTTWATSALRISMTVYFFHGLGVYLKFLDFAKLRGFIRSFLLILTIFTARPLLSIVGFVDEFIDFRKLMLKKNQGE